MISKTNCTFLAFRLEVFFSITGTIIRQMKCQNKFWNRILFQLFTGNFYRLNILEKLKCQFETNNWNIETYKKKLEKRRRKKSLRRLLLTNGVFWSKLWPCFCSTTIGPKMQIMHACHTKMRSKCTIQDKPKKAD